MQATADEVLDFPRDERQTADDLANDLLAQLEAAHFYGEPEPEPEPEKKDEDDEEQGAGWGGLAKSSKKKKKGGKK